MDGEIKVICVKLPNWESLIKVEIGKIYKVNNYYFGNVFVDDNGNEFFIKKHIGNLFTYLSDYREQIINKILND
jgi:hypothetical protein